MVYDKIIKGRYIYIKSADDDDAEFSLSIRQDPELTKYLPVLNNTLDQQKEWIRKVRESQDEYFFIIFDINGKRLGVTSVYNIKDGVAEVGRFAMYGEPKEKAEYGILMVDFYFNVLCLEKTIGWVICGNRPAFRWNESWGAVFDDPVMDHNGRKVQFFHNTPCRALKMAEKYKKLIYRDK